MIVTFSVVALVVAMCGTWYWQYVASQTLYLKERNFRALATTSQALAALIANYGTVFKSIIEGAPDVHTADYALPTDEKLLCAEQPFPQNFLDRSMMEALCALPNLKHVAVHTGLEFGTTGLTVRFVGDSAATYIKLKYVLHERDKGTTTAINADVDVATVMQQLMSEEIFTNLLLANSEGKVVYQRQSTGHASSLEMASVAFLFEESDGSDREDKAARNNLLSKSISALAAKLPLFKDPSIGGIRYKVFGQSGRLPDRDKGDGPESVFILAGMIPAWQFDADVRAFPINKLLLSIGIILAVFFVLPYVKLRSMQPTERVTPGAIMVLVLFSLMGTALLTVGIAACYTYARLEAHLDGQLRKVAEHIKQNFEKDLESAIKQLIKFDDSCNNLDSCNGRLQGPGEYGQQLIQFRIRPKKDGKANSLVVLDSATCSDTCTPALVSNDVNTMLWIGPTGSVKALWSREAAPWKRVVLHDREYVRRIWEREPFRNPFGDKNGDFWIEPIYSWTTGENYTVLSKASTVTFSGQDPKQLAASPNVAALELKMPALVGAIIPPGMGFAVIGQDGRVLFHSDSRRNLRENFFEETDNNIRLRQAVLARIDDQFDGRYWGKDRHFGVSPMPFINRPDVYWSLVTYWDKDLLRVSNMQALFFSGALFFIYSTLFLGIGVLGCWIYPSLKRGRGEWLWPQPQHCRHYQIMSIMNLVSLCFFGWVLSRPHAKLSMFLWALIVPVAFVGVYLIWRIGKGGQRSGDGWLDFIDHRQWYCLLIMTVLLAYGMAPAFGLFNMAMNAEMRSLIKFSQFDLAEDRKLQEQAIRTFYRNAAVGEASRENVVSVRLLKNKPYMYRDFPFEVELLEGGPSATNGNTVTESAIPRLLSSTRAWLSENFRVPIQQWDEDMRSSLQSRFRVPLTNHMGLDVSGFIRPNEQWRDTELGLTYSVRDLGPHRSSYKMHTQNKWFLPAWLFWVLAFGGPCLLIAPTLFQRVAPSCRAYHIVLISVFGVCLSGLSGLIYPQSTFTAVLFMVGFGAIVGSFYLWHHLMPRFAVSRMFLLDSPHKSLEGEIGTRKAQRWFEQICVKFPTVAKWPLELQRVFVAETGISEDLRSIGETMLARTPLGEAIGKENDHGVAKEQIIQAVLAEGESYYRRELKNCSKLELRSLFNLARDRFLHGRNPSIRRLLQRQLISVSPGLCLMNESFRRFVVATGLREHLDQDKSEGLVDFWAQLWRPIVLGVVVIAAFLVLTQEEYQAITLAFLGALPALLGAFSQLLNTAKKDKLIGTTST